MRFKYLTELGDNFLSEIGTAGHRVAALTMLETHLKKAIVDLKAALMAAPVAVAAPAAGLTGVAALRAKHEALAKNSNPNAKFAELEGKVTRLREWLKRQNCVVGADGSIDWALSTRVVQYDSHLAKQGMTRLRFRSGRAFLDDAGTRPLDTAGMVTMFSGPGHAIFVMSEEGNIHVSAHSVGERHHSSLLAGKDVAGAGELQAVNGHITWLSNKSGHYVPSAGHLLQVLHMLQKQGVPMTFAVLLLPDKTRFPTVEAFMKHLQLNDEPDYELMKLMAYSVHLTDAILAARAPDPWRWRNQDSEAPGVYSTATNQPVPHLLVRQWLKGQGKHAKKQKQPGAGR